MESDGGEREEHGSYDLAFLRARIEELAQKVLVQTKSTKIHGDVSPNDSAIIPTWVNESSISGSQSPFNMTEMDRSM